MSINLNVDVSGVSALLQRASALIAGNRAQHGANERLARVKERAGDLDLAGQAARQKMADAFEAAAGRRLAEQQRQRDSWADRKPIGHRHDQFKVALAFRTDVYTDTGHEVIIAPPQGDQSISLQAPSQGSIPYNIIELISGDYILNGNMVMPVGGDRMIFSIWWDWHITAGFPLQVFTLPPQLDVLRSDTIRTFVISKRAIREIPTPATYLDSLNSLFSTPNKSYWNNSWLYSQVFNYGHINSYQNLLSQGNGAFSWYHGCTVNNATPSAFGVLANHGTLDSSLDATPTLSYVRSKYAQAAPSVGIVAPGHIMGADKNVATSFTWQQFKTPNPLPRYIFCTTGPSAEKDTLAANYTGALSTNTIEIIPAGKKLTIPITNLSILSHPYNDYASSSAIRYKTVDLQAWDWGNPAYCRQQLLALGFTADDLKP